MWRAAIEAQTGTPRHGNKPKLNSVRRLGYRQSRQPDFAGSFSASSVSTLFAETPEANLSAGMHRLNGSG